MDFTKSKVSLKNWVSKNVRVANIQATIVWRCSNEPDLKADSKSVRISEISQQMPEIPTFFSKKEGKKQKKISGFLISVPYRSHTGKERKKEEILSRTKLSLRHFDIFSQILPTFCQDNKVKPWKFWKTEKFQWKTWLGYISVVKLQQKRRRNENLEEMSKWTRLFQ